MSSLGSLRVIVEPGEEPLEFPLRHTDVRAAIAGMVAHVTVTQTFANPYEDTIEAVYVFPLPENAAVNDMTMKIGDRTIRGLIKKRTEAREIYEQAREAGQIAGLLEQERPNIFTRSVANITPGAKGSGWTAETDAEPTTAWALGINVMVWLLQ